MPQLCTPMPPGGATAAERAGGLGAVWGVCGCLFVGVSIPWRGTAEGRGDTPLQGHDNPFQPRAHLGPLNTRHGPSAPGRRGASSSAACRAGRARHCPGSLPARPCPLSPGSSPGSSPAPPARLRLSAARPQLPPQIRCRRAGRERGNTCFQHGEGGEGERAALPGPAAGSLPSNPARTTRGIAFQKDRVPFFNTFG